MGFVHNVDNFVHNSVANKFRRFYMNKQEVMTRLGTMKISSRIDTCERTTYSTPIYCCIDKSNEIIMIREFRLSNVLKVLKSIISNGGKFEYKKDPRITGINAWIYTDGVKTLEIIKCCDKVTQDRFKDGISIVFRRGL